MALHGPKSETEDPEIPPAEGALRGISARARPGGDWPFPQENGSVTGLQRNQKRNEKPPVKAFEGSETWYT